MSDYDPNYVPVLAYFLLGVKVIIENQKGQVLLLQRSDKASSSHDWGFPGGGVDKNENPSESAKRECLEESGLHISDVRPISTTWIAENGKDAVIIGFTAKTDENDITLSWEHENYQWVDRTSQILKELPDLHQTIYDSYLSLD